MHFAAVDMDTNGDHMISREEMEQKLGVAGGKETSPNDPFSEDSPFDFSNSV